LVMQEYPDLNKIRDVFPTHDSAKYYLLYIMAEKYDH